MENLACGVLSTRAVRLLVLFSVCRCRCSRGRSRLWRLLRLRTTTPRGRRYLTEAATFISQLLPRGSTGAVQLLVYRLRRSSSQFRVERPCVGSRDCGHNAVADARDVQICVPEHVVSDFVAEATRAMSRGYFRCRFVHDVVRPLAVVVSLWMSRLASSVELACCVSSTMKFGVETDDDPFPSGLAQDTFVQKGLPEFIHCC